MLSHAPNEHMIIDCVKKFTLVKTKLRTPMAGLRRYFKPTTLLPTASETGIGELATTAANEAVARVIEGGGGGAGSSCSRKRNFVVLLFLL